MDKKKLFKFLDVALLLIFLVPVIIPQYIDTYINLWVLVVMTFVMIAYSEIRSKFTKRSFGELSSLKQLIVSFVCLLAMFLIDILIDRFGEFSYLRLFEFLVAITAGEICETYFAKTRV